MRREKCGKIAVALLPHNSYLPEQLEPMLGLIFLLYVVAKERFLPLEACTRVGPSPNDKVYQGGAAS